MNIKKLIALLFIIFMGITLAGCEDKPGPGPGPITGDKDKLYLDSEIPTPNTDKLTLDESLYLGKEFLRDGIGVVQYVSNIDGDTTLFKSGSTIFTVRYLGIDTPESTYKVEPWGFAAARFVKKTLEDAQLKKKTIVLQAEPNKNRFDSTGKRYLAWVWVDGRLLNLEIVEKCYSASKAAGTTYAVQMNQASIDAEAFGTRIWNRKLRDPDYDYSETGVYMNLEEIHEKYNNPSSLQSELDKGKKIRVQGIVSRRMSIGAAYIQQRVDGYWFIGETNTKVVATRFNSEIPYIGENGHWFVEDVDLNIEANGEVGQTAYDLYKESLTEGETPLSQIAWVRQVITTTPTDNDIPYIVQEDKWYGIYLYGGFDEIIDFKNEGREIFTESNLGYYHGTVQLTGVNNATIKLISLFEEVTPKPVTTLSIINKDRSLVGLLVSIGDLRVTGGYNGSDDDYNDFTVFVKDSQNREIQIRFQKTVTIFDENGNRVGDWKYFEGKTFTNVVGILGVYVNLSNVETFQILVNSMNDLTY